MEKKTIAVQSTMASTTLVTTQCMYLVRLYSADGLVVVLTVPAQPGQDELQHSQKYPGSPCTSEATDGVQSSQTGTAVKSVDLVTSKPDAVGLTTSH